MHPDHIQALGLPEEFIELATRRSMAMNDAYDKIKRERGIGRNNSNNTTTT